ncbi:16S rRNA-processing protein RimM [Knoellia sinensis KCTC 19936]|uniref:Ribosome maturation factor RimM n=1 Tax=Knoellia sinensis KCTC 19936 TaxID=1385520 RepID=A0A0A0J8B8_9MICO|nr:ribosome maturation factor RimM [Knoellia sinensis]KGN31876.1 16S rRNA-processing protein RimM [Knoellia sinensis KCTC 19936]
MSRSTDALLVARIGKPHGLRGEVTVQTHTDDPERRFVEGTTFETQAAVGTGVPRQLTLATARKHREIWLLGFAEIPDRTGAESLRGTRLFLDVSATAHDDTDEDDGWYEHDLVGLAVQDPSGATLGEVTGLVVGAAQDLLEVRLTGGREALVPFVEAIVTEVDTEAGHVVVDAPAGLFDLDES